MADVCPPSENDPSLPPSSTDINFMRDDIASIHRHLVYGCINYSYRVYTAVPFPGPFLFPPPVAVACSCNASVGRSTAGRYNLRAIRDLKEGGAFHLRAVYNSLARFRAYPLHTSLSFAVLSPRQSNGQAEQSRAEQRQSRAWVARARATNSMADWFASSATRSSDLGPLIQGQLIHWGKIVCLRGRKLVLSIGSKCKW